MAVSGLKLELPPEPAGTVQTSAKQPLYTDTTIQNLANGVLDLYERPLIKTKEQLQTLTDKQEQLLKCLTEENNKLILCQNNPRLNEMMGVIKMYSERLINVKKDMLALHDHAGKLKKRAFKLQKQKEAELLHRQVLLRKEQDLIVKREHSANTQNT